MTARHPRSSDVEKFAMAWLAVAGRVFSGVTTVKVSLYTLIKAAQFLADHFLAYSFVSWMIRSMSSTRKNFLNKSNSFASSGNTKVHPGTAASMAAPNGRSSIPSNTSVHAVSTSSKSSSLDVYIGTNIAKTIETFV